MSKTMTFEQWQEYHRGLMNRAEKVRASMTERARRIGQKAGLAPDIVFLHAHNAMVDHHYGKPWRNVDYHGVRKVQHIEKHLFDAHRKAKALSDKAWERVRWPESRAASRMRTRRR